MDQKTIQDLIQKVKGGSASTEERTQLLRVINESIEELNKLLKDLNETAKKNVKSS